MRDNSGKGVPAVLAILMLVSVLTLAGVAAVGSPQEEDPTRGEEPASSEEEAVPEEEAAAEEEAVPEEPAPEPRPRIIRVVCTDHICGHCDGKCHRESGHVAIDKKGHCACTPTEGSALDRATREAYEKKPPK